MNVTNGRTDGQTLRDGISQQKLDTQVALLLQRGRALLCVRQ